MILIMLVVISWGKSEEVLPSQVSSKLKSLIFFAASTESKCISSWSYFVIVFVILIVPVQNPNVSHLEGTLVFRSLAPRRSVLLNQWNDGNGMKIYKWKTLPYHKILLPYKLQIWCMGRKEQCTIVWLKGCRNFGPEQQNIWSKQVGRTWKWPPLQM